MAALLVPVGCGDTAGSRQEEIAGKGATVMPFDLDRTTHVFDKESWGGIQTVTADEPDAEQVALVRAHIREETEAFRQGDFSDPAAIHGLQMPGIAELQAGAGQIEIRYADVPEGARIGYRTDNSALVRALHLWFDAQVSDHGEHARMMEGGS